MKREQPKITFFLDRTHGNLIREMLPQFGFHVKACNRMYPPDFPDVDWIKECASEKWIILSGNKAIEEVPAERQAVIDGKCKVFMFDDTNSKTEEWIAAILVGRRRIFHLVDNSDGPFFVTIRKFGHSHLSHPRFVPNTGAGWRPEHKPPAPVETIKPARREKAKPRQPGFWEDETGS